MSGQKAFFLTGANAKIKVNGVALAFCTNISYSVTVNHASPVLLGMYEGSSVEPLSYEVVDSFSLIRYVAGMTENKGKSVAAVQDRGNGLGTWGPEGIGKKLASNLNVFNGGAVDGKAYDNLNPKRLDRGTTFDIEIFQQYVQNNGALSSSGVAKLTNCRITKADFSLNKRGVAQQNFQFRALYASEDSFIADFSGLGQHLA